MDLKHIKEDNMVLEVILSDDFYETDIETSI